MADTYREEVSSTASGRLMMMEAANPYATVRRVARVWPAIVSATARLSTQMRLGAGSR